MRKAVVSLEHGQIVVRYLDGNAGLSPTEDRFDPAALATDPGVAMIFAGDVWEWLKPRIPEREQDT